MEIGKKTWQIAVICQSFFTANVFYRTVSPHICLDSSFSTGKDACVLLIILQSVMLHDVYEPSLVALEEWLAHQQSKNVLMWELNFVILLHCIQQSLSYYKSLDNKCKVYELLVHVFRLQLFQYHFTHTHNSSYIQDNNISTFVHV